MVNKMPYHLIWDDPECDDAYLPVLVGPNGFECVLTEPEDRTWSRDGAGVVDELNRLQARADLAAKRERELAIAAYQAGARAAHNDTVEGVYCGSAETDEDEALEWYVEHRSKADE